MTGVILQVRTGSKRLPGKALLPLGGMPMLAYILRRFRAALIDLPIVVATTILAKDDTLEVLCKAEGIHCFRGSEDDVLQRYYECALQFAFSHVIRMTGDNPFTDLEELMRLIDLHQLNRSDYSHSLSCLPVGVGAEIFTFSCLEKAHREGHAPHHREHVNEYVIEHPEFFNTQTLVVAANKCRPDLRLTVDTPADYEKVSSIVNAADGRWVNTEDAIAWLLQSA